MTECSAALFIDGSIGDDWPENTKNARIAGDFNFLAFELTDQITVQYYRRFYGPLPEDQMSAEDAKEPKDIDIEQGETMQEETSSQHAGGKLQAIEDIPMGCISETQPDSYGNSYTGDRDTLPVALAASYNIFGRSSTSVCIQLITLRPHPLPWAHLFGVLDTS